MNDFDLSHLDSALGDGPALPPVDVHLRAARRALWRWRAAVGVGALAVLAAAGTGVAATLPTPDGAGPGVVEAAGDPTPPSEPHADGEGGDNRCPPGVTEEPPSETGDDLPDIDPSDGVVGCPVDSLVWLSSDGELVLGENVRLLQRIPDPFGLAPDPYSEAVATSTEGKVTWRLLTSRGYEIVAPADADTDLRQWTNAMVAAADANGGVGR
ncbi:MAG: hypothetical protein ACRDPQ_05630 [Nocardioidaceae bacterium]